MKIKCIERLTERKDTGCLTIKDPGDNHNFKLACGVFVKNSSDGKGSQIDSVGGNSAGFTALDDIFYFQKKLYKALKYPMERVTNIQENRASDSIFMGSQMGQITRSEIAWAKFLERHQNKFCDDFVELFLLHLELKGLKKEYELDKSKFTINMTPPNNYKYQMSQQLLASKMDNYSHLSNDTHFSPSFLMREFLGYDDAMLEKNMKGFEEDKKYFPKPEEEAGGSY